LHVLSARQLFQPALHVLSAFQPVLSAPDVTDAKRAENELRAADRRKSEFLAILAHALRNPLAPIRNGLQILRLADDRPTVEEARGMMSASSASWSGSWTICSTLAASVPTNWSYARRAFL
jgi:signal transduction histidine kinase